MLFPVHPGLLPTYLELLQHLLAVCTGCEAALGQVVPGNFMYSFACENLQLSHHTH